MGPRSRVWPQGLVPRTTVLAENRNWIDPMWAYTRTSCVLCEKFCPMTNATATNYSKFKPLFENGTRLPMTEFVTSTTHFGTSVWLQLRESREY
jgi:hypothetical protein